MKTLFASILKLVNIVSKSMLQMTFSDAFFAGTLKVKLLTYISLRLNFHQIFVINLYHAEYFMCYSTLLTILYPFNLQDFRY